MNSCYIWVWSTFSFWIYNFLKQLGTVVVGRYYSDHVHGNKKSAALLDNTGALWHRKIRYSSFLKVLLTLNQTCWSCLLKKDLNSYNEQTTGVWISLTRKSRIMSHHQLWEHAIQLIVSWHRQWRLHGLQGKVLPKPVGDLRVIAAVKTAEDEREATTATSTTFPRSHGCPMCSAGQVGRVGGSFRASLQPPPPQS